MLTCVDDQLWSKLEDEELEVQEDVQNVLWKLWNRLRQFSYYRKNTHIKHLDKSIKFVAVAQRVIHVEKHWQVYYKPCYATPKVRAGSLYDYWLTVQDVRSHPPVPLARPPVLLAVSETQPVFPNTKSGTTKSGEVTETQPVFPSTKPGAVTETQSVFFVA